MKHTLTNPATHFAMLLMALAMAFTFLACGEKKKAEAEQAMTEEEKQAKALKEEEAAWLKEKAVADAARAEAKAGAEAEKAAEEEEAKKKAACPEKKIGSPITAEAVFLKFNNDDVDEGYEQFACYAYFRLSNGEEIMLFCGDTDIKVIEGLKKDIKVSITHQKIQRWNDDYFNPSESVCYEDDELQSVKLLPK